MKGEGVNEKEEVKIRRGWVKRDTGKCEVLQELQGNKGMGSFGHSVQAIQQSRFHNCCAFSFPIGSFYTRIFWPGMSKMIQGETKCRCEIERGEEKRRMMGKAQHVEEKTGYGIISKESV
jgi:hypothetical protein